MTSLHPGPLVLKTQRNQQIKYNYVTCKIVPIYSLNIVRRAWCYFRCIYSMSSNGLFLSLLAISLTAAAISCLGLAPLLGYLVSQVVEDHFSIFGFWLYYENIRVFFQKYLKYFTEPSIIAVIINKYHLNSKVCCVPFVDMTSGGHVGTWYCCTFGIKGVVGYVRKWGYKCKTNNAGQSIIMNAQTDRPLYNTCKA